MKASMLTKGARFRLVSMSGDPFPIPAGATGTVTEVVDVLGVQVWVEWDPPHEHRRLALVGDDEVESIEDADEAA